MLSEDYKVKCPRCKKKWELRDPKIQVPPMYRYCKDCEHVVSDTGAAAYRARFHSPPRCRTPQED